MAVGTVALATIFDSCLVAGTVALTAIFGGYLVTGTVALAAVSWRLDGGNIRERGRIEGE